jgi:hypothetical protein
MDLRLRNLEQLDTRAVPLDAQFVRLDEAREKSPLPEEPRNEDEVRDWLIGVRRARFV